MNKTNDGHGYRLDISNSPRKRDPLGSSAATGYKFGQHVCFVMEDQCEVRGIVRDINDYPDFRELKIELDDNEGWYYAKLRRR